jgi:hypothetical protein
MTNRLDFASRSILNLFVMTSFPIRAYLITFKRDSHHSSRLRSGLHAAARLDLAALEQCARRDFRSPTLATAEVQGFRVVL